MEKGFNSDVFFEGQPYHVQTEDWGVSNPFIVTRVYLNGGIVKSVKSPYSEVVPTSTIRAAQIDPLAFRRAVLEAIRAQHERILDQLISGHLL